MNRTIFIAIVLIFGVLLLPSSAPARGFGGFHAGGFSGGSFGGSRAGGFGGDSFGGSRAGGFGGDSFGGSRAGGFDAGGFHEGGYAGAGGDRAGGAGAGGFRAGDYGASLSRGQLGSFLGLPTDGGFHAAGGASMHAYQGPEGATVVHGDAGVRGAAVGPGGAAAGGRYAGVTAVKTPAGNVYTHDTTAGRGIAAGPEGVTAGRYAGTRTAVNGTAVASRGYAAYGTRAWSPTYCHAQAVAGQGWCYANHLYTPAWTAAHPWAWFPAAYAAADWVPYAWTPVTWTGIGTWLDTSGAQPYAYNYGSDINYQDGSVYSGSQYAGTADQYYQQASSLASSTARVADSADTQWLPLGVFGLMEEGKTTPDMVFQLAVNRSGAIRGNYFDQVTQTNLPVTGAVDKKTQRAAWQVAGGKGLVVETGLYNLTQNDSTALVHYDAGRTEQEVLVRMKQPPDGQGQ